MCLEIIKKIHGEKACIMSVVSEEKFKKWKTVKTMFMRPSACCAAYVYCISGQ